jgi:hypothetical protein
MRSLPSWRSARHEPLGAAVAALDPGRLRRLHPALPFVPDEIHLLFRGDAHRTRAFVITKDAIVEHGRALDDAHEE